MKEMSKKIAEYLLQSKAIKLEPAKPFTWASGWKSPIYCDNRQTLSFPEIRTYIRNAFVEMINKKFKEVEVIAGVATGAIAHGALVAESLGLPFVYVRSKPKGHGMENLIEGRVEIGQNVVVIEDLISTGGSSIKAVETLQNAGCSVLGMCAIFSYLFPVAKENFKMAKCDLYTLSNYEVLIDLAVETQYIKPGEVEVLKKWRQDPGNWNPPSV